MPSTDIDGSPILIVSETEGRALYSFITSATVKGYQPSPTIIKWCNKIAKTFGLRSIPVPMKSITLDQPESSIFYAND